MISLGEIMDEALAEQQRQEDLWQDNDPFADSGDE